MALLPIIQYPDPVLAAKAEPVTEFNDELRKLAADMAETMYAAPGLSLKGLYEKVSRPDGVTVCAQDLDGKPFEIEATGLLAVCLQHELDHLDGTVFIDHLSRLKKDRAKTKLRKLRKNDKQA